MFRHPEFPAPITGTVEELLERAQSVLSAFMELHALTKEIEDKTARFGDDGVKLSVQLSEKKKKKKEDFEDTEEHEDDPGAADGAYNGAQQSANAASGLLEAIVSGYSRKRKTPELRRRTRLQNLSDLIALPRPTLVRTWISSTRLPKSLNI